MAERLRTRLDEAVRRGFVGRTAELERIQEFLVSGDGGPLVSFVHAPGGVGKTTLLRRAASLAAQQGMERRWIDASSVAPDARSFESEARIDLEDEAPTLIIIDAFEHISELEPWLRESWLPELPAAARVLIAGRQPPSRAWRSDLSWADLLAEVPLRNFDPEETSTFLTARGVAASRAAAIHKFTHGHPLALNVFVESNADAGSDSLDFNQAPDALRSLLDRFRAEAPSEDHRRALEAAAIVRCTNESMLRVMLERDEAFELFEWLADLSFMETGPRGVYPHDLVRELVVAELNWRDPAQRRELHSRARLHYLEQLKRHAEEPESSEAMELRYDLFSLHRNHGQARDHFVWGAQSLVDTARPNDDDWDRIEAAVARFQGEESLEWLRFWAEHQPESCLVFRDAAGSPVGFVMLLRLDREHAALFERDPGTAGVWHYLERRAPLRGEERAILTRFWLSLEEYQAVSSVQSLMWIHTVGTYNATPNLAASFATFDDCDFWGVVFSYMEFDRLEACDFDSDGRRFGVFGRDWRTLGFMSWQALLFDRSLGVESPEARDDSTEALVLSRAEFDDAVKQALRHLRLPGALADSPLLRSRLVQPHTESDAAGEASSETRADILENVLVEAVEGLEHHPSTKKAYRALRATYLEPAPTQEEAANRSGIPFSTYRRHLARGVSAVADALWRLETG